MVEDQVDGPAGRPERPPGDRCSPRDERRRAARARILKTGKIVLSEKAPKIECTVRNLSEGGACLQVSTTYGIPSHFDVILDGVRRHCRVAWATDTRLGVAFE